MSDIRKTGLMLRAIGLSLFVLMLPLMALASTDAALEMIDLTAHWAGILSLVIFVAAYSLVIGEEVHAPQEIQAGDRGRGPDLGAGGGRLSCKPATSTGRIIEIRGDLLEFVELFLFLLAAMTFINTMEERGVFDVTARLAGHAGLFAAQDFLDHRWVLAFLMSPIADNLTTALLMAAVVGSRGRQQHQVHLPWPASISSWPPMPAAPSAPSATSPP